MSALQNQSEKIQKEKEPFKKYCCGAIKRLKQKCLRFNDNDENICKQFIEGHQECRKVKNYYQSIWNKSSTE